MEQPLLDKGLINKIYSVRTIRIATFIGGPLVAAYLMAANFKQFGEGNKVARTWLWSMAIFTVIIVVSLFLPDSIPSFVYNFVFFIIASFFLQKYQAEKIETHINSGGLTYKTSRAVLIAVLGMLSLIAIILGIYAIADLANLFN
jgi:hypothetical protein